MKTLAQSLTVSTAIYSVLFILLISLTSGVDFMRDNSASAAAQNEFTLQDEAYVDDIPFDTRSIAEQQLLEEAMAVDYTFEEEAYVDDIPFDTEQIASWNQDRYASVK